MSTQQIFTRVTLCLLAWCTLAITPALAQIINHVPLFTFDGESSGDEFGFSVSGAGDVNGDGYADVIVAAPDDDNNGADSGSVRVISGNDGSVLYNFNGDSAGDLFGFSIGAGDVNGDGFSDLIVAAPTNSNSSPPNGSVRVLSGIDGSTLYTFNGDPTTDFFGRSASGAGDVNGDGFDDVIVGIPLGNMARVFSGADGSVLYNFVGDSADDLFGRFVNGAGDLNGDGFDEVIVSAPMDDNNGAGSGSARVFSGADGSVLYDFDGDSAGDGFGRPVSGVGDVNGDGVPDLIVGIQGDDNNGNGSGSARVFSGADGSILYTFNGDPPINILADLFGTGASSAGDVNDDGFDDLIVATPGDDNNGFNSGNVRVFSGADGSIIYNIDGNAGDIFGTSASGAGDVNGDGVADFIVGALNNGGNDGGYATLYVSEVIILGDCDLGGEVNLFDIAPFIEILSDNGFLEQADINRDEVVSFLDIAPFIEILMGG